MNETINITKDTEDAKFEDFVKQSENSLIYQSKNYLDLVDRKFGSIERKNIEEMAKIKLKRKALNN